MSYFEYRGKSVYYGEYGQGTPLIFLHGNTASSKMFELLMPLYSEKFRCILIDFLGNGKSDRIENFHRICGLMKQCRPLHLWNICICAAPVWQEPAEGRGQHECGVRASGFI